MFKKLDYAHNNYSICEIDLNSNFSDTIEKKDSAGNGIHEAISNINESINFELNKIIPCESSYEKSKSNINNINNNSGIQNIYNSLLVENSKIFIEYKDEEWFTLVSDEKSNDCNKMNIKKNFIYSKFIKFFDEKLPNIEISFNIPIKLEKKIKITVGSYKFNEKIEIKPNKTLKELKKVIAQYINLEEDCFIMKKNSHNGIELKNLSETIDKICTGNSKIYIEYGCPQKENEIKINLFLCELDMAFFLLFPYKIIDLGFFNINIEKISTIKDLKKFLIEELQSKKNLYLNNSKMTVIRDYLNERPTKIYSESQKIKDLNFTNNKKIFIQEIKTMQELKDFDTSDIQLTVREWDSENWKVSEPIEIHLKKKATFLDLAKILREYYPKIKSENLSAYKIGNGMNIYMDDILKYKFENLYENSEYNLDSYPLFINCDGSLLLICDNAKIARKPTEEEKRLLCRPKFNLISSKHSVTSNTSLTSSMKSTSSKNEKFNDKKFRIKEKALKITVKKNDKFETDQNLIQANKLSENYFFIPESKLISEYKEQNPEKNFKNGEKINKNGNEDFIPYNE